MTVMKKIGIDARLYFQTGVGVYLRNFLHFLQEPPTDGLEFYVYIMSEDAEKIDFSGKNFVKRQVNQKWHSAGEQFLFLKTLLNDRLDLMHFTYFSYPIFYSKKFVATIHDTILLKHKTGKASTWPSWLYETKHLAARLAYIRQMRNAAKIITPTETVRRELIEIFGTKYGDKIVPIHEGVNYEFFGQAEDDSLKSRFGKNQFFMYVGNFYPHKNVEALVKAFARVKTDKRLVLAGPEDYFAKQIIDLIISLKQSGRIFFYKKPTNNQLIFFYKNALALIHPSLSEGFCLPLVEAAYFKLPVIGSDIPVFHETIGNHYMAFDPYSLDDMTDKISRFLTEGKHSSPPLSPSYSFKKMSEKILDIYHKV